MRIAGILLLSYLAGSIPVGLIVGKLVKGIDIRRYGSGNIGATNVLRTLGIGPAIVVFVCDTLKGLGPVLLCKHDPLLAVSAGIVSILGHNFSLFLRFQGGKGVATSLGVMIGIHPAIAAIAFGVWLILVGITRYISVASIITAVTVPLQMWLSGPLLRKPVEREYLAFGIIAAAFIIAKHKSNIARLLAGTEAKIGQKASV